MAKMKFDLRLGSERIRSIEEFKKHFSEEEVLVQYRKNNTLWRWLDVHGHDELAEKVESIEVDDDSEIIAQLCEIFDITLEEKSEIEKLFDKSDSLFEKEKFSEAIEVLKKILELDPDNYEVEDKIAYCENELLQQTGSSSSSTESSNASKKKNSETNPKKIIRYEVMSNNTIRITHIDFDAIEKDKNGVITIPSEINGRPVGAIGSLIKGKSLAHLKGKEWEKIRMLFEEPICDDISDKILSAFNKSTYQTNNIPLLGGKKELTSPFKYCNYINEFAQSTNRNINEKLCDPNFKSANGLSSLLNRNGSEMVDMIKAFPYKLKIKLSDELTEIDEYAFANCFLLSEIEIPSTITTIRDMAFVNCVNLKELIVPEGVKSIENMAICGYIDLLKKAVLPDSLEYLDDSNFRAMCVGTTQVIKKSTPCVVSLPNRFREGRDEHGLLDLDNIKYKYRY